MERHKIYMYYELPLENTIIFIVNFLDELDNIGIEGNMVYCFDKYNNSLDTIKVNNSLSDINKLIFTTSLDNKYYKNFTLD